MAYITTRLGRTDADEFPLQQQTRPQNMFENNYDGMLCTMDIVVLNRILQDFCANKNVTIHHLSTVITAP